MSEGCCGKFRAGVQNLDQFGVGAYLRYGQASEYSTFTGGVISIVLIVFFLSVYMGQVISTFRKDHIDNNDYVYQENDPSQFTLMGNESNFMFFIGLKGVNLSDSSKKYFDIMVKEGYYKYSKKQYEKQTNSTKLTTCDRERWATLGDLMAAKYDALQIDTFLCLPPDYVMNLGGKYSSPQYKYWKIIITKCDSTINTNCATDAERLSLRDSEDLDYKLDFLLINTAINTADEDMVNYYLQDRYYWQLREDASFSAKIYIREHQIETDQTILPYEDISTESHFSLHQWLELSEAPRNTQTKPYWSMTIRKSGEKLQSTREYRKLFQLLGDIGGIFSFATMACFFIFRYQKYCYELEMADRVFTIQKGKQTIKSDNFNFGTFLKLYFYEILTQRLGLECVKTNNMQILSQSRREIKHRLNVNNLICNLLFLDRCMQFILKEHQLKLIHLQRKFTLDESEKNRKVYQHNAKLQQNYELIKQIIKEGKKRFLQLRNTLQFAVSEGKQPFNQEEANKFRIEQINKMFDLMQKDLHCQARSNRERRLQKKDSFEDGKVPEDVIETQKELGDSGVSMAHVEEEEEEEDEQRKIKLQIIGNFKKLIKGVEEKQMYSKEIMKSFEDMFEIQNDKFWVQPENLVSSLTLMMMK